MKTKPKSTKTAKKAAKKTVRPASGRVIEATLVKSEQVEMSYRILEFKEMEAIESEDAQKLTDAFCYEFTQTINGKEITIRGIRAVGAREAIRFSTIKLYNFIPVFAYESVDLGEGYYREIATCKNPNTGEITSSSAQWRRGDRFSDRTARTIAERNAMIKHLPGEVRLRFINYCVKRGLIEKVNVDPRAEVNAKVMEQLPAKTEAVAGTETQKKIATIYAIFGAMRIDAQKARIWIHKRYKVKSVKDLDNATLDKIIKGLKDIEYNVPGKCPKPKDNCLTPDLLKDQIHGGKYDKE